MVLCKKDSFFQYLLTFLVGMICGSFLLFLITDTNRSRSGEWVQPQLGRSDSSSSVRVLQDDGWVTEGSGGCPPPPPPAAFSSFTGQGVHSFMTQEFIRATSPESDKVIKHHYELMYAPFLARFHHTSFKLMEIGVEKGNSILSWGRLFPRVRHVYGVGYGFGVKNTNQKQVLDAKTTLYYADQSNTSQLDYIIQDIGRESLDVIIDDGSHIPWHQVATFDVLFRELLSPGGTYIIEDIETSYWSSKRATLYQYQIPNAGVGQSGSVVERFKSIVDVINRKFFARPDFSVIGKQKVDHLVSSISFSRNCIIIEKMNPQDGWSKKTLKTKNYKNSGYVNRLATDLFVTEKEKPISGLP